MVFSYVWLLLPFQCGVVTLMLCCCFICSVGLLRSCYVVASSSLCGVVTLMLRCCFLFTVWGWYAYATLLLPFRCVGLLRLCYVVTSFSLWRWQTLLCKKCRMTPANSWKKMLRRRHDGPNIFLQETTPILILLLCATIFDKWNFFWHFKDKKKHTVNYSVFGGLTAKNAGIYTSFAMSRKSARHETLQIAVFWPLWNNIGIYTFFKNQKLWLARNPVNNSVLTTFGD